ncbi:formate dehydrogenase accessory sulfurtransferase FdhD [Streptomyces sp. 71268]|uniref:formate dehydrogenase accessory sulfurtransferase FdhD n=1 Tax=Streptomyces sp. 71268 TaxID=3002640 RepID=UPI0023F77FAD|nr:formate dehydrogenase accessory sulfurtransferase FdhD [Streptomyces sp. 71268]WEV28687.1 formate dehydrogenase accessory sulfurtransferase FdhD [Streptomyces sp. 71268]
MGRVTERRRVVRIRGGKVSTRPDTLVAEEPLEIRLNGKPLAITMRTPGDDFALAAGFLVSEGVLARDSDLATIAYCAGAVAAPREESPDELVDGSPGGLGDAAGGGGGVAAGWAAAPLPAAVGRRAGGVGRGGAGLPVIDTRGGAGSAPGGPGARGANTYNVVDVHLAPGVPLPDIALERNVYTTSSCGLCGKASLDAVRTTARWPVGDPATPVVLSPDVLAALPDRLRAAQRVFERTGGLHAAALFTAEGELLDVREDVGRHNAVDKLVGRALQQGRLPLSSSVLLVSGRASFELAQKAVMAGIPVLAAVSAPSSLAVDLAEETGLTLVGFLRGADMNVYAGAERVSWEG